MGCINSKKDLADNNRNIYRVLNVDADGVALWSAQLEISPRELILHRKGKELTTWSLQHLRRYGFDGDIFTFEAGRRCTTGEGIYAFRCRRAESLFHTLQAYIEGIASNDGNTEHIGEFNLLAMNGPSSAASQPRVNRQSLTNARPNSMTQSGSQPSGTNYIIPNNRLPSLSSNGAVNPANPSRSTDALAAESNYLEPMPLRSNLGTRYSSGARLSSVSSGPLSPEPNSPSSPNSFTNILEVTQLNQQQQYQNSNLYQEFPLRSAENNNNLLSKKLSLDIPPQEQAPAVSAVQQQQQQQQQKIAQPVQNISIEEGHMSPLQPVVSPTDNDSSHMYVNVTPGELDGIVSASGTPPVAINSATGQTTFAFNRFPTQFSIDATTRCYENLEAGEIRNILGRTRYSKPDIFAKVDLPSLTSQTPPVSLVDKSEPSTPTNMKAENHKVNYIVLDLDQSPSSTTTNTNTTTSFATAITTPSDAVDATVSSSSSVQSPTLPNSSSNATISSAQNTKLTYSIIQSSSAPSVNSNTFVNSTSSSSLLKPATSVTPAVTTANAAGTIIPSDYATIDFDKTVALSNSTAPSSEVDNEGSRKTRHSSTAARHSNSISD